MARLARGRGDLTPKTKHSEEEDSNPAWTFAQLRCLGFSLVSVSDSNLVSLIRISRPPAHSQNATGARTTRARQAGHQAISFDVRRP